MMIHLPDAPLANRAVVSSLWLNAATAGALEYQLALSQVQRLDHLFRSIALRDGTLEGEEIREI